MSGYLGPFISGGGGGGAGGTEVFRWNRVDTTQFEGAAAFADGGSAGTLSVVAVAGRGNVLRLTATAGTTGHLAFLAVDPLPFLTERRDFIIQAEIQGIAAGGGGYGGFVVLADDVGSYYALNHLVTGVAEWASRVDGGTRVTSISTGAGVPDASASFWQSNVRGNKLAGTPPLVTDWPVAASGPSAGILVSPRRSGATASLGLVREFGDGSAYPAGWNDLALDRWGLCLQSSGGNPMPTNFDILDLRVYIIAGD